MYIYSCVYIYIYNIYIYIYIYIYRYIERLVHYDRATPDIHTLVPLILGFGIICNHTLALLCEMIGIQDMSADIRGRFNKLNLLRCAFLVWLGALKLVSKFTTTTTTTITTTTTTTTTIIIIINIIFNIIIIINFPTTTITNTPLTIIINPDLKTTIVLRRHYYTTKNVPLLMSIPS